ERRLHGSRNGELGHQNDDQDAERRRDWPVSANASNGDWPVRPDALKGVPYNRFRPCRGRSSDHPWRPARTALNLGFAFSASSGGGAVWHMACSSARDVLT